MMAQPRQAANSELLHRSCVNLGTHVMSSKARDRADSLEGLPLAPPNQPEALSLVVTGICYNLGMLLALTASPAPYPEPLGGEQ